MRGKTLVWTLSYIRDYPGCSALDVPANKRCFMHLERVGLAEFRNGGWYITNKGEIYAGTSTRRKK